MEEILNPSNPSTSSMDPKSKGTNSTLNKLIAGDFLQTLGQELGLRVLLDTQPLPFSSRKPPKLGDSRKRSEEKPTVSMKERGKISLDQCWDHPRGHRRHQIQVRSLLYFNFHRAHLCPCIHYPTQNCR